eukprot:7384023-Prymnesium_polylepis.3
MADEQGAAPAAAPRVRVIPHRRFSDSIQPPGGWVHDPSDVRQTRSADADDTESVASVWCEQIGGFGVSCECE